MRKTGRKSNEQKKKEARTRAVVKTIKKNYKRYEIKLHKEYDSLIIDQLEQQENKTQYIISLISKDIKQ